MIDDLKPYPQMKDSGVRWLGEVPLHWEVRTVGRLGQLFKGNGASKADEVDVGVPCVRYGDLYTRHEFFITKTKACVTPTQASEYTPIRFGDLLFAASGETDEDIGRSAVNLLQADARCGGDVLVLRPSREFVPRFLGYAADSPASRVQKATMGRGFTVVHIYGAQLRHLALAVPPLPEQAAIVRFLDHADRRIRRYIRAKQKLIKLLEEQKQAIIHRAVTRGLDPDVRLKPAGVEWLGDVPEHWEVERTKNLFRLRTRKSGRAHGLELLSIYTHIGVRPRKDLEEKGNKASTTDDYWIVRRGDLIVNKLLAWMGAVGVSDYDGVTSPAYDILMPIRPLCPAFYHHLFRTKLFLQQFKQRSRGIMDMRLRLYFDQLGQIPIVVPPVDEQTRIVAFCADATAGLDRTVAKTKLEINLLREYRTRLIADVVTGKLDVRAAAARLPDDVEELELHDESVEEGEEGQVGTDDADEVAEEAEA